MEYLKGECLYIIYYNIYLSVVVNIVTVSSKKLLIWHILDRE